MYSFIWKSNRETLIFPLLVYTLQWPQQPGLGQAKAERQEFCSGLPHECQGPRCLLSSADFPGILARRWVGSRAARTRPGTLIWDPDVKTDTAWLPVPAASVLFEDTLSKDILRCCSLGCQPQNFREPNLFHNTNFFLKKNSKWSSCNMFFFPKEN